MTTHPDVYFRATSTSAPPASAVYWIREGDLFTSLVPASDLEHLIHRGESRLRLVTISTNEGRSEHVVEALARECSAIGLECRFVSVGQDVKLVVAESQLGSLLAVIGTVDLDVRDS